MCNVSQIMDTWQPYIPPVTTIPLPTQGWPQPRRVGDLTVDELKELLAGFHLAVQGAETFDRLTGQPDCVDPEKAKLMERVEALEKRLAEHDADASRKER
jgi:hypothetical protein